MGLNTQVRKRIKYAAYALILAGCFTMSSYLAQHFSQLPDWFRFVSDSLDMEVGSYFFFGYHPVLWSVFYILSGIGIIKGSLTISKAILLIGMLFCVWNIALIIFVCVHDFNNIEDSSFGVGRFVFKAVAQGLVLFFTTRGFFSVPKTT